MKTIATAALLGIAALSLGSGCTYEMPGALYNDVVIAPDFNDTEMAEVESAIAEVNGAIGPERQVRITLQCAPDARACTHFSKGVTKPEYAGFAKGDCRGENAIQMNPDAAPFSMFRMAVMHELGHIIGCKFDHLPEGNVMYWQVSTVNHLTAEDVKYMTKVRQ